MPCERGRSHPLRAALRGAARRGPLSRARWAAVSRGHLGNHLAGFDSRICQLARVFYSISFSRSRWIGFSASFLFLLEIECASRMVLGSKSPGFIVCFRSASAWKLPN